MSTFKVEVVKIRDVQKHPNADRLDLITIADWQCVTSRGSFKVGDLAVYFPIDSVLPDSLETKIFGPDSKVKLHNHRVKTIKLRGAISQGMAIQPNVVGVIGKEGTDVTEFLGVTKYEPPVKSAAPTTQGKSPKTKNPNFKEYTGIENAKWYPDLFSEGEPVIVTEKIHGTNFRAGWVPYNANTWWKKALKFLGLTPSYEFVYGSHHVELTHKKFSGYYTENVYAEAVEKYKLKQLLHKGQVVYGEIYGAGIQKGYTYGCGPNERKVVFFDLMMDGEYLDYDLARHWFRIFNLPQVPQLYSGPFTREKILALRDGPSLLDASQKVREGIVVRPKYEGKSYMGRVILKYISDEYLLRHQDDESIAH